MFSYNEHIQCNHTKLTYCMTIDKLIKEFRIMVAYNMVMGAEMNMYTA